MDGRVGACRVRRVPGSEQVGQRLLLGVGVDGHHPPDAPVLGDDVDQAQVGQEGHGQASQALEGIGHLERPRQDGARFSQEGQADLGELGLVPSLLLRLVQPSPLQGQRRLATHGLHELDLAIGEGAGLLEPEHQPPQRTAFAPHGDGDDGVVRKIQHRLQMRVPRLASRDRLQQHG